MGNWDGPPNGEEPERGWVGVILFFVAGGIAWALYKMGWVK